mmetsp:Transcript_43719/g.139340  ORF Transcript_43719/g.139340 Transcript_43719/m.139340 type:complete len:749 (+) Transcript_43719:147-2393(+)
MGASRARHLGGVIARTGALARRDATFGRGLVQRAYGSGSSALMERVGITHRNSRSLAGDTWGPQSPRIWDGYVRGVGGRARCAAQFHVDYGTSATAPTDATKVPREDGGNAAELAEDCDKQLGELDLLKEKERRRREMMGYGVQKKGMVADFIEQVVAFIKAVPGGVRTVASMSREEWVAKIKEIWRHVKEEAHHYWVGTKLLWFEVKVSARLVMWVLKGKTLSRRERGQLTRTTSDILRLVPMSIFVLIPFMELLLPVALKLFPNMLPSTFQDKAKKEEELKKRVVAKIEVARFLQDTVEEMAKDIKKNRSGDAVVSAKELTSFITRVRSGGYVSNADIVRFAKLFNDELTLDNLERLQLTSLCKFIGITDLGSDGFLRYHIRNHLRKLKEDDHMIQEEGVASLDDYELRAACRARGMRAVYGSSSRAIMEKQLGDWLDLSLNRALPSSLLLLSRALTITRDPDTVVQDLQETLGGLPEDLLEELSHTKYGGGAEEDRGTAAATARKLEYLKHQDELIHEEAAAWQEHEAKQAEEEARAAEILGKCEIEPTMGTDDASRLGEARDRRMKQIKAAFRVLASSSAVTGEREQFLDLVKKEISLYSEVLAEKGGSSLLFSHGALSLGVAEDDEEDVAEKAAPTALSARVDKMLASIEAELDEVDRNIGEKLKVLDRDGDGVVSKSEIAEAMSFLKSTLGEEEVQRLLLRLDADLGSQGEVHVTSLMSAIENIDKKGSEGGDDKHTSGLTF